MFIRVEDDILERAAEGGENNRALNCLIEISIAVRRGKHYVFIPGWVKYDKVLAQVLPDFVYKPLRSLRRMDGAALNNELKRKLIVTEQIPDKESGLSEEELEAIKDFIYFSPSTNPSFEIFEETHLLCENINESRFYALVEDYYRKYTLPQFKAGSRFHVFARNGGGTTSDMVVDRERTLGNHLILVVCDSDYKYCFKKIEAGKEILERGEKGDTAKKLEKYLSEKPYSFCELYVLKYCSEVENLIPKKYLRDLHPNNDPKAKDLLDKQDVEYLDLKEGVRIIHLFDDKVLEYRKEYLIDTGVNLNEIIEIKSSFKSKKRYKEHLKDDKNAEDIRKNLIVDGWGSRILEQFLDCENLKQNGVRPEDLTEAQKREWNSVGRSLFSWGIAAYPSL